MTWYGAGLANIDRSGILPRKLRRVFVMFWESDEYSTLPEFMQLRSNDVPDFST